MAANDKNPEEKQQKSRMDMLRERNTTTYPDDTFDDDDAHVGRMMDDYEALNNEHTKTKGELEAANGKLGKINKLFKSDARSSRFLMDWADGKDPVVELYKKYGDEAVEVLQSPEKLEEFAKEREEYLKGIAEDEALSKEAESSVEASLDALDELEASGKMSAEDIDKGLAKLSEISRNYMMGKFGEEEIRLMLNAVNHDKDVAEAEHNGTVRGKTEKARETLRKPKQGDGMPNLDGGGNIAPGEQKKTSLGALDRFDNTRDDIYSRGGERRISRR